MLFKPEIDFHVVFLIYLFVLKKKYWYNDKQNGYWASLILCQCFVIYTNIFGYKKIL